MRYYCPECKNEYNTLNFEVNWCFICKHSPTVTVPDFETPAQYEKRTGKKWNGAVWFRYKYVDDGINGGSDWCNWHPKTAEEASKSPYYSQYKSLEIQRICANSPEPPPDDYVLEVEA